MKTTTLAKLSENLTCAINEVTAHREPIFITGPNGKDAVLISREDFDGYEETLYLMRSAANAKCLMQSIEQADAGELIEKTDECKDKSSVVHADSSEPI